jgi:predicted RNA-binding Zn ribbon-like protein
MDGETHTPSVQPGGRDPAPGRLALVQAFINTHYDLEMVHGAEVFATPRDVERWFRQRGLVDAGARVSASDHVRVLAARDALRDLARGNGERHGADEAVLQTINELAPGAAVELRFDRDGPQFLPAAGAGIAGALGLVLARVALAISDGSWARLKICPGDHCDWAFYDHSRNQTGRWCSMAVCGGRAKARSHYRRRRRA